MKFYLQTLLPLFFSTALLGQNMWQDVPLKQIKGPKKDRASQPSDYRTLSFDANVFLDAMTKVAKRTEFDANNSNTIILEFPLPNGKNGRFKLLDAELMHPDLAAKFPQLKNYIGQGINDPTARITISYSPYFGFSGMIRSGNHSTVYIDPITTDNVYYMCYYRKNIERQDIGFTCFADETNHNKKRVVEEEAEPLFALGDCNLRQYRLAQSCTGEYAQFHITQAGGTTGTVAGDKAIVQAAMNVTLNRVNGIYELDFGMVLQFIPNNDLIIYLNEETDPWTDEWNTKTAQTIDEVIGVANYDIGHNFNDKNNGRAGCFDCVCLAVSQDDIHKGRGFTGQTAPVGDPFDVDYVAHEMGHQFGGYHTQSNESCRSVSGTSQVEPGSGSTIMGYAGICATNVQNQSDDYFAYVNIYDIVTAINFGNSSACAQVIASGNPGPTASAGVNYTIPISTPFLLQGVGTDPNNANLTYCWEQNDPENPGSNTAPLPTRVLGPMFRSLRPVTVPYRYMPNLAAIVDNASSMWEVLPVVSRDMEFSFTVRDNNINAGCTDSDLMEVTTDATSGPFLVTSPNTAISWTVGHTETVTWEVANTTAAPVNCANVDIFLSTDGGFTYPINLARDVPNDGAHPIVVPDNKGDLLRVQIICSDNIFFDISNTNFCIGCNDVDDSPITALELEYYLFSENPEDCYVQTQPVDIVSNSFSFVAWVKPTGIQSNYAGIVFNDDTDIGMNFRGENNMLGYQHPDGDLSWSSGLIVPPNEWSHVAFVVAPTGITVYVNGEGATHSVTTNAMSLSTLKIGSYKGWVNYTGLIEEVSIWNKTLSTQEIRELMHHTLSGSENDLMHYFQFNETSGSEVVDRVAGKHASLVGNANRNISCVPLGIGVSQSQPQMGGLMDFTNSNITMDYNAGVAGNITASIINVAPCNTDGINSEEEVLDNQYFVITHYDTDGFASSTVNFQINEYLAEVYETQANKIKCYGRDKTADGTWTFIGEASSVDVLNSRVSFDNFASPFEQFVLCREKEVAIKAKVFLEGFYAGAGKMQTQINDYNLLPNTQPYQASPWNYSGTESNNNLAADVVDWILLEVRDENDPNIVIEQRAGLLLNTGEITAVDDRQSGVLFYTLTEGTNYRLVVRHRNHLAVISENVVNLPNSESFNFSSISNVFGGLLQLKYLEDDYFALVAGDYNADGVISVNDLNGYATQISLINVYSLADFDGNKVISVGDFNMFSPNVSRIGASLIRY